MLAKINHQLFFPEGSRSTESIQSKRRNSTAFKCLAPSECADEKVVSQDGIEPSTRRLRERLVAVRPSPSPVFHSEVAGLRCLFVRRFPPATAR
jgi:hypothetical protein